MHINYIPNEKYLQMHLFSWQSIDWTCEVNILHLVTVGLTLFLGYVVLDEQMPSQFFHWCQAVQVTEQMGFIAGGDPKIKAAYVCVGDSRDIL